MSEAGIKVVVNNKRAYHDYSITEKLEAGIVLVGTEVKSIREGNVRLAESFCFAQKGELFIKNMYVSEYKHGNVHNHVPDRSRKLLLKKRELERLVQKSKEKGLTIVPLRLYLKNSLVKLEIGLGKGKKLHDKREDLKTKAIKRDMDRNLKIKT